MMTVQDFPGKPVLLDASQKRSLRKTFFPPLFLLESLTEICPRRASQKTSDAPPNSNQSPVEMFHTLVNKLAQICDHEPKGDTVTALAIICQNGRICYILASNRRGTGALRSARASLQAILNILKNNLEGEKSDSDEVLERRLLYEILFHNAVRVRSYLTSLSKSLDSCMKKCDERNREVNGSQKDKTGRSAKEALENLASILPDTSRDGQKGVHLDINSTMQCIETINNNRTSPLQNYIGARAVEDNNLAKGGCWATLQHAAGRLLSYRYAAQTLVHAHRIWADTELFRDFDIECLRSSNSYPKDALNSKPETAQSILNRMPGCSPERGEVYKQQAADLQRYNLDARVEQQWNTKLEPIVHAEMLLHDWLSRTEGGTQPGRFFQGWQYIGTSKPVCRLCQEYFNVIATPVQFRSGHPNLYLNWKLPDMYVDRDDEASAEAARKAWNRVLDGMKSRIYAMVVYILKEKVSESKPNDSNTFTDRITGAGDVSHLANWLESVQLK